MGDLLLTRLAIARSLGERMGVDLLTLATWWTPTVDAAGLADPAVYPDDGPLSVSGSPYYRLFLGPAGNDAFRVDDDGEIAQQISLADAVPALAAVLGAQNEDLVELLASAESGLTGGTLTRANLSAVYRAVSFARAARLSMADLLDLRLLTGLDPFDQANPAATPLLLDAADTLRSAGVTVAEVRYLVEGSTRPGSAFTVAGANALVTSIAAALDQLRRLHQVLPDPAGDVLRRELVAAGSTSRPRRRARGAGRDGPVPGPARRRPVAEPTPTR